MSTPKRPLHPQLAADCHALGQTPSGALLLHRNAILPWMIPLFAALVAITFVPEITLWLPRYLGVMK